MEKLNIKKEQIEKTFRFLYKVNELLNIIDWEVRNKNIEIKVEIEDIDAKTRIYYQNLIIIYKQIDSRNVDIRIKNVDTDRILCCEVNNIKNYSEEERVIKSISYKLDSIKNTYFEQYTDDMFNFISKSTEGLQVTYFNEFMRQHNIQYRIGKLNDINWKIVCERVPKFDSQFFERYYDIIDWETFAEYANIPYKDMCDFELIDYVIKHDYKYLAYNKNISLDDKFDFVEGMSEYDIESITDNFIAERGIVGNKTDDYLMQYLSDNLPIDWEKLCAKYPLPIEIVNKFIDKISIDNLKENKNLNFDIQIIFKFIKDVNARS